MKTFYQFVENQNTDEEKRQRLKQLVAEINQIITSAGGINLTKEEAEKYKKLSKEIHDIKFDLSKPVSVEKLQSQPNNALPLDVIATAWNELIANKNVYDVIMSAATGAGFNQLTDIDNVLLGLNPVLSREELINAFSKTRQKLKENYGNTIKLYRAKTKQIQKPTTNWASTAEFAQQFGPKVISKDIPIDKIVAINVNRQGTYHELIVMS